MAKNFELEKKKQITENPIILPSDVRYALQYREAKMGRNELLALANNQLERESLYLLLKATADNPEKQRFLIQSALEALSQRTDVDERPTQFIEFLHSAIAELPQDETIVADKLGQLSRQGFDVWHKSYDDRARELSQDNVRDIFLVGHATLIGLDSFCRHFKKNKKDLYILIPDQINNEEISSCGYMVSPDGNVSLLPKDFVRSNALVIDDTIHTGKVMGQIVSFWTQGGTYTVPDTDAIAKVNLRS